ncbi:MAG: ribonuclease D [Gammaproteobacteria bacterium]|nr:ribonuclease D [Gammaproteobacteria bacterium]
MPDSDNSPDFLFVDNTAALNDLCQQLRNDSWLAVDTEFVRDSTYYPEFCLLQIGNQTLSACIDVLAIDDLAPVLELLFNPDCVKVFHAATQDLEIFYHLCQRIPQPVFDTQLAAPLLGFAEQVGYATLVNQTLGVQLAKGQQRTDWSKRPLSYAQLDYAAGDVRYLAQLYPKMRDGLTERGRIDWLSADFEQLVSMEKYAIPIEDSWRRIKATKKLKGTRLRAAQRLAAWREQTARSANKPRNWIVRDEALIDIATVLPTDRDSLSRVRSLKGRSGERYYDALLKEVQVAKSDPMPASVNDKQMNAAPVDAALVDLLMALVQLRAEEHEINANLLASRKSLEQALRGDQDSLVLNGWRAQLIGDDIQRMIKGELALSIQNKRLAINSI